MDEELRRLLDELREHGRENDRTENERGRKMMNLDPDTARVVSLLLRSSRRQRLLEIGTSNGYSTIWLAWSMRQTGGRMTSVDRNPEKHRLAEKNLARAGLRELVELRSGDATQVVHELPGPFDAVFFDADRLSAPAQLAHLAPKLSADALLMADNALSHPDEISGYLDAVAALPGFDALILPIGKGLSVAYRSSPPGV